MDPYLSRLAITMMDKFTAYEEFNIRMNKLQIAAIQFLKEGGEFTKKHLDSYIILINEYNDTKDQYLTAKKIYEEESIEIEKEAAEAKNRLEASTRPYRTFLYLQNGTFGIYGLTTEINRNIHW